MRKTDKAIAVKIEGGWKLTYRVGEEVKEALCPTIQDALTKIAEKKLLDGCAEFTIK